MATTGAGLMKLPSMGSSPHLNQVPSISPGNGPIDRRRASITDPCLHAHSAMSLVTLPTTSFQSAHDPRSTRGLTLPSLRALNRHSKNSVNRLQAEQDPNTLQSPSQQLLDAHSLADPSTQRRGSAADLDHILLNPDSRDQPPLHQPSPVLFPPSPTTAQLNLTPAVSPKIPHLQSIGHHPFQPSDLHSPTFDPSSSNVHLLTQPIDNPVSPKSFPTAPSSTNPPEPNHVQLGPVVHRRPSSAFRRRGSSRVNELDTCQSEDPSKLLMSGPGLPTPSDHSSRGLPASGVSQWPYPTPHHRHHLHKPSSPVKRRNSSHSILETPASPPTCIGLSPQQVYCPPDYPPPNSSRFIPNHPQCEPFKNPSTTTESSFDARRQSEASTSSSSGVRWLDRRPSEGSGESRGLDDNPSLVSARLFSHRSSSTSSKNSMPQFSPSETAHVASMNDYAFPSLSYNQQADRRPSGDIAEDLAVGANSGWRLTKADPFDEQTMPRRGSGVSDVHELKDRLAGTRLLDRQPIHSISLPPERLNSVSVMVHNNPSNRPSGATSINPYSRSPELKISHKLAERKRRKEMRELFDELREVLPVADQRHSKGSKWETLSRAVGYMQQIRIENERLKEENSTLQSQVQTMNHHLKSNMMDQIDPKSQGRTDV